MKSSLIRFLTFAAGMTSWIYVPIFAKDLDVSDTEIGLIVAFFHSPCFYPLTFLVVHLISTAGSYSY